MKKIIDPGRTLDATEELPTVSFTLTRYYGDENSLVRDNTFKMTGNIHYDSFLEEGSLNQEKPWIRVGETTFNNLPVYAPDGSKYRYMIDENTGTLNGAYTVKVGEGSLDSTAEEKKWMAYDESFTLEKDRKFLFEPKKETGNTAGEPVITFMNTINKDTVKLKGKKVWDDNKNESIRPGFPGDNQGDLNGNSIPDFSIQLERRANAQSGGNSKQIYCELDKRIR